MGWEEIRTSTAICPCGKGIIIQKHFGDDWNRFQDGPVKIECEECSKKYIVEEIIQQGLLSSDGTWCTCFLTPINYPEYSGTKELDMYPSPVNRYSDFTAWLVENYTEDNLKDVISQLRKVSSSAELKGVARRIRELHKKVLETVRICKMIDTVESALEQYANYNGTKEQREAIRMKENIERSEYLKEKRKHQVAIDLR